MTNAQAKVAVLAIASLVLAGGIALWDVTGQVFLIWSGMSGFAYLGVWHMVDMRAQPSRGSSRGRTPSSE